MPKVEVTIANRMERQIENRRLTKWKAIEIRRSFNKYYGPIRRQGNLWAVYRKGLCGGISNENLVGHYDNQLEAVKVWDDIQRAEFPFPAPVNIPTKAEAQARLKEKEKLPIEKEITHTIIKEQEQPKSEIETLTERVTHLETIMANLDLDKLTEMVVNRLHD